MTLPPTSFGPQVKLREQPAVSFGLIAQILFNVVKNNLTVNSGKNEIYYHWASSISGNTQISECNDFNAPEKLDYRVVSGSSSASGKDILTTAYDIENIGMKTWIGFKALLSVDDAKALKEFFLSRGIQYESI